jgi:hypothetical protein
MLRRPVSVRRHRDLAHSQPMVGRAAVFQNPDPDRAELYSLPGVRSGDRYLHGASIVAKAIFTTTVSLAVRSREFA